MNASLDFVDAVHYYVVDVQQAPIILLKEGTDTSQGKPQLVSNINACQAIVDAVRTTLGPRGMDKLIVDNSGVLAVKNMAVSRRREPNGENFTVATGNPTSKLKPFPSGTRWQKFLA